MLKENSRHYQDDSSHIQTGTGKLHQLHGNFISHLSHEIDLLRVMLKQDVVFIWDVMTNLSSRRPRCCRNS